MLELWDSPELEGVVINYGQKPRERRPQAVGSKYSESSQNSRIPGEIGVFDFKYKERPLKKRSLLDGSESSESSQNSWTPRQTGNFDVKQKE